MIIWLKLSSCETPWAVVFAHAALRSAQRFAILLPPDPETGDDGNVKCAAHAQRRRGFLDAGNKRLPSLLVKLTRPMRDGARSRAAEIIVA
jgi:hypothetical protein